MTSISSLREPQYGVVSELPKDRAYALQSSLPPPRPTTVSWEFMPTALLAWVGVSAASERGEDSLEVVHSGQMPQPQGP